MLIINKVTKLSNIKKTKNLQKTLQKMKKIFFFFVFSS